MSDYYGRVNKLESSGKAFIISLWQRAEKQGFSSGEIHDSYLEYLKQKSIQKAPRYVREYLRGVYDTMQAIVQHSKIEFCYVINGERYSIRKDSPLYYESHGYSPKQVHDLATHSGHYWIDNGKEYYVDKMSK